MSYFHIDALYRVPDILLFKECWAMEKIHGTSAHVAWDGTSLRYFAGGGKHETFVALFDEPALKERFTTLGYDSVTVYGEAYGGKQQGMKATYGDRLRFIAFEVKVGETWLSVEDAHDVAANKLGFEFVHFEKIPATPEALDAARNAPSVQAVRNGITEPRPREGVVVRPLIELFRSNGKRMIAKYVADSFRETTTPRTLDPARAEVLKAAEAIALEWVTNTRLQHVLDALKAQGVDVSSMRSTGDVVRAMIEDVRREGVDEIEWSAEASKAIGSATSKAFKAHLESALDRLRACDKVA